MSAFKQALIDAFDAGINKTDELNQALKNIETEEIRRAFSDLGVESAAQLQAAADKAKAAFEKIRSSGIATTEDLQRSFTSYAKTVIDANNGVVPAALQHEAAQYGVKIAYDETGRAIITATNALDDFHNKGRDGANQHAQSLSKLEMAYMSMAQQQADMQSVMNVPHENKQTRAGFSYQFSAETKDAIDQLEAAGRDINKIIAQYNQEVFRAIKTGIGIKSSEFTLEDRIQKLASGLPENTQKMSVETRARETITLDLKLGNQKISGQFDDNEQTREMLRELERASRVMQ